MARKRLIKSAVFPYHVTARSNNRDWFTLPLDTMIDIYIKVLRRTHDLYEFRFEQFVLMTNHFHMLVTTPKENLDLGMRYFMTESSRAIARSSNRINRIYGQRYHWTMICDPGHYAIAYKYVARNPVAANLCITVEDWKWSSLGVRATHLHKLMSHNLQYYDSIEPLIRNGWLNSPFDLATAELVARALKKRHFKFPIDRRTRRPVNIDALLDQKVVGTF